jgi:hypothetical protein
MAEFYPTLRATLAIMANKNYRVFKNESGYDLNIVGVRTKEFQANRFDDFITVFYRLHNEWIFNCFTCTTDPGSYWLENPMSGMGTAILKEGQYRGAFRIGRHKRKYAALVQNSPFTVIRDANRDTILDLDLGREETGMFGINIHRASEFHESIQVDKWSAGCQVFCDPLQFGFFMNLCKEGRKAFGNSFTYTLLHENDFS